MGVRRIKPNVLSERFEESRAFYTGVIGLEEHGGLDWIRFFGTGRREVQLSVMTLDVTAGIHADVSIEVDDVDEVHARAVEAGAEIVHPLTDEEWGLRRFFLRDPNGVVLNVTQHAESDEPDEGATGQEVVAPPAVLDVDDGRRALSSAAFRGDGPAIVEMLSERGVGALLQHAGAALLVALAVDAEGAPGLAPSLVRALRERDTDGDDVVAEQLIAATTGPPTGRLAVPADLDMLADLLEGDPSLGFGGYLDLTTGESWPAVVFDDAPDEDDLDLEDDERWLGVPHLGSRDAWSDMSAFASTLTDVRLAEELADAIEGRGAFSRFRRVLDRHPDQVPGWLAFRDERRAGRARSWLAVSGYDAR